MKMSELIKEYREKLSKNDNDYSCLLFALQIPSICSRIEFPQTKENTGNCKDGKFYKKNGKVWDSNIYKHWLKFHIKYFEHFFYTFMSVDTFCDNIYDFRCQITHEGVLMSSNNRFFFIENNKIRNIDIITGIGNIVFCQIPSFCKAMFDAAESVLTQPDRDLDITIFKDMLISTNTFNEIQQDIRDTYHKFWENYSEDDKKLNCIYDHISLKKDDIDNFFKTSPDGIFEIWDFSRKYGLIVDYNEKFIVKKFDKTKSKICLLTDKETDVLQLTKTQYERMLQVVQDLDEFSKKHPFDILKYL